MNKLVNIDRDLLLIPNVAPHIDRDVNKREYNMQKDMLPIYGDLSAKGTFMRTIAQAAGVEEDAILGHDLYLYVHQKGTIWGPSRGIHLQRQTGRSPLRLCFHQRLSGREKTGACRGLLSL